MASEETRYQRTQQMSWTKNREQGIINPKTIITQNNQPFSSQSSLFISSDSKIDDIKDKIDDNMDDKRLEIGYSLVTGPPTIAINANEEFSLVKLATLEACEEFGLCTSIINATNYNADNMIINNSIIEENMTPLSSSKVNKRSTSKRISMGIYGNLPI